MADPEEQVVGPVFGPQSAIEAGSASDVYFPSNAQFDVAIGGLPFCKAPSDDHPYARETADFRRQQIDQAPLAGDQSLTGMWTRGQLSFHHGAGVRYYELADGETVINRFTDSLGVDVWTPGEVSVRAPVTEINSMDCADVLLFDDDLAVLRADGTVHQITYAGSATALTAVGGGTAAAICTDGVNLYATNADDIEKCAPGGAFATLFSHPTAGKDWVGLWWAKDRLWMMDEDGDLYVEAPSGTLAAGDLLWSSGYEDASWSLCESDGAVFIASRDTIWASTVDAQTATPVLGAPVVVARVGAQETIGAISDYLGYLVVTSSAGIRVARIGDSLALGDLVVEGDASGCSRLGARKSLSLATINTGSTTVLVELDLLEQVSDLQPAYAPVRDTGATTGHHGGFVLPDGRVGFFSSQGLSLEDATLGDASGYVTTGFHRFGTLEPKDFRTISVYATGSGGSIGVELIRRDGAAYSLVTLTPGLFGGEEVALNMPTTADYVGLRFTITADSGEAPTLLGYQLRALPAPKRQRLIQIPLHCFDEEVIANTKHGYKGWAKDRLLALESMEQNSGAVIYQDFNLGTQETVLIEKIQFQNVTPPRPDKNGFGGIIMATVRVVA